MSPSPVTCAFIGSGQFVRNAHLPALAANSSLYNLVACYSRSEASAQSVADAAQTFPSLTAPVQTYYDSPAVPDKSLDALLARDDISTLIMALPIPSQPAYIEKAWAAGKHVLSEKPVAKDVAEATRLINLYESTYQPKGIQWIIMEQFAYEPTFQRAAELLAAGAIGTLRTFQLEYNNYVIIPENLSFATAWRKTPDYQGGFLLDGGVHFVGGLRRILSGGSVDGDRIATLSAFTTAIHEELPPADTLHAVVRTQTGVPGFLKIGWGIEADAVRSYTLQGSKGKMVVDFTANAANEQTITITPAVAGEAGKTEPQLITLKMGAMNEEFKHFALAIQGGAGSQAEQAVAERSGPRIALRDLAVIQAALSSDGQQVSVIELLGEFA